MSMHPLEVAQVDLGAEEALWTVLWSQGVSEECKGRFIWANWANSQRFDGDVVAGIPQGIGRMQYASGDDYNGRLNAGVPDGHGTYTWKND